MNPPININDLFKGTTVEWERLEFKKAGIQKISYTPSVHLQTIFTILAVDTS